MGVLKMYLIIDTETNGKPDKNKTGFEKWPRITQLAYKLFDENKKPVRSANYLIEPDGWEIPKEQFFIDNGMSTERNIKYGIKIFPALVDFQLFSGIDYVIGHNVQFDLNCLKAEFQRCAYAVPYFKNEICTMFSSIDFCAIPGPRGNKWPKLQELYQKLFDKDFENSHDAMNDVNACAECFFKLVELEVIKLNG